MTAHADHRLPRRRLLAVPLLLPLVLAACDSGPPTRTDFPPLAYDYLSKIKLAVATVDIDDDFDRRATTEGQHVEASAPVRPADALKRMAQDRLLPAGSTGHAVFVIEDASLLRTASGFEGSMAVRLDVSTSDGQQSGFAEAKVSRTYGTDDTSEAGTRAALYTMVKLMMSDMNVEFEYWVKHKLRDYVQTDEQTAPPPEPVQSQDINGAVPQPGTDQVPAQPAAPAQ
jgi:hypothetical protein